MQQDGFVISHMARAGREGVEIVELAGQSDKAIVSACHRLIGGNPQIGESTAGNGR